MTDRPSDPGHDLAGDPAHDPAADPAAASVGDEAAVRRLLAEARHDDPMPVDVAARLDAALADLRTPSHSGRHADPQPDPHPADVGAAVPERGGAGGSRVSDLTVRRRRARALLVAAAAAVVVGVGVGVVRNDVDSTGGGASSSADSSGSGGSSATTDGPGSALAGRDGGGTAYLPPALGRPVPLSPQGFGRQVRRLEPSGPVPARPVHDGTACVPGGFRDAALVPVRYEGKLGLLVYRRPAGESRVVDLFLCGQEQAARSVTLATG